MKFIYIIIIIIFFYPSFLFAQTDSSDNGINLQGQVPRIEFESTKYDFGDIYRGSLVSHSFSFENTGNGVLVLSSLHATCGCLNTKIFAKDGTTTQNLFKPGEGGVIRADFDSSQFSGNVVRSITAETNMGSSYPTVTLTLTANVLQELYSSPPLLYIGRIDTNTEKTYSIKLNFVQRGKESSLQSVSNLTQDLSEQVSKSPVAKGFKDVILNNHDPLKAFAVESTVPAIEAKLNSTGSINTPEIQIKINHSLPIGPLNEKLIVWNNSTYYKNFQIPIVGEVVGRVDASAKYVEFGVVSDLKASERVITYSSSLKNFSITSVKINLKRLPEMKDLHDSELFIIRKEKVTSPVKFDPDSAVAYKIYFRLVYPQKLNPTQSLENSSGVNVSGNFLVKTNDPDYKEITVPFFGVLRKSSSYN